MSLNKVHRAVVTDLAWNIRKNKFKVKENQDILLENNEQNMILKSNTLSTNSTELFVKCFFKSDIFIVPLFFGTLHAFSKKN